jgi:predicted membrane protein
MRKNIIFCFLAAMLLLGISFAHQPRLVSQTAGEKPVAIQVQNPEISQAFYGELKGSVDTYEIDAKT